MSQFFDAIRAGDAAQVRALLAADPGLAEARTAEATSAVLWSLYTRHPELAPLLLSGREPDFFEACALGRTERAAVLLRDDPSLARADAPDGFSGLGLAVFFGHVETARRLVEAGADVNRASQNAFRVTPLHSAVESGKMELLELLLTHGANPNPGGQEGASALESAIGRGNQAMVERLRAAGAR